MAKTDTYVCDPVAIAALDRSAALSKVESMGVRRLSDISWEVGVLRCLFCLSFAKYLNRLSIKGLIPPFHSRLSIQKDGFTRNAPAINFLSWDTHVCI